jgi:hypothetical protein
VRGPPLREFFRRLLAERPALQIRMLIWDWPLFYSLDREPLPQLQFGVARTRASISSWMPTIRRPRVITRSSW